MIQLYLLPEIFFLSRCFFFKLLCCCQRNDLIYPSSRRRLETVLMCKSKFSLNFSVSVADLELLSVERATKRNHCFSCGMIRDIIDFCLEGKKGEVRFFSSIDSCLHQCVRLITFKFRNLFESLSGQHQMRCFVCNISWRGHQLTWKVLSSSTISVALSGL